MKFTLGTTYYENPEFLQRFIKIHQDHVDELIVVDDGSQKFPAIDYMQDAKENVRLYRVKKDYGFNSHGCRNLIVRESKNDWIVLSDVDREFYNDGKDILKIYDYADQLEENVMYKFVTHIFRYGNRKHQSVNDFMIHRNTYLKAGGYDEEIIGIREGDRDFFYQLYHFCYQRTLQIPMLYTRGPTAQLDPTQKGKPYPQSLRDLVQSRMIKPNPDKPQLTFEWEKVF